MPQWRIIYSLEKFATIREPLVSSAFRRRAPATCRGSLRRLEGTLEGACRTHPGTPCPDAQGNSGKIPCELLRNLFVFNEDSIEVLHRGLQSVARAELDDLPGTRTPVPAPQVGRGEEWHSGRARPNTATHDPRLCLSCLPRRIVLV